MNLWIQALSHLLHVLGTVVWIGGILMTLLVILPSSKAALESAPMVAKGSRKNNFTFLMEKLSSSNLAAGYIVSV